MGGSDGSPASQSGDGGKVFLTVGTTRFDALVEAVDEPRFLAALRERGFSSLLIQLGRGSYLPASNGVSKDGFKLEFFTFAPDIAHHIRSADLVISHAGSGSVFETLRAGSPLVVVVNEALMDNHQSELAEELADRKHLFCATPSSLVDVVRNMDVAELVPYPASSPAAMVKSLDQFLRVWVASCQLQLHWLLFPVNNTNSNPNKKEGLCIWNCWITVSMLPQFLCCQTRLEQCLKISLLQAEHVIQW